MPLRAIAAARIENLILQAPWTKRTLCFLPHQNFLPAHRLADGNALGNRWCRRDGGRCVKVFLCRAQQRVAVLALQRDDLREAVDHAAFLQVLQREDRAEKQRAVSRRG